MWAISNGRADFTFFNKTIHVENFQACFLSSLDGVACGLVHQDNVCKCIHLAFLFRLRELVEVIRGAEDSCELALVDDEVGCLNSKGVI